MRVATRISEFCQIYRNQFEIDEATNRMIRYDLSEGYQCVRDLLLCLETNVEDWPDVCSLFQFKMKHSTTCLKCYHTNSSETIQMYLEVQVPPDMSIFNKSLEEVLNQSELVTKKCEENCKVDVQAEKRMQIQSGNDVKFLIVVMTRGIWTKMNRVIATNELFVR